MANVFHIHKSYNYLPDKNLELVLIPALDNNTQAKYMLSSQAATNSNNHKFLVYRQDTFFRLLMQPVRLFLFCS